MERRRLSRGEAAFMIGVPLAWAVLLLFHPSGEGDQVYLDVQDEVAEMLAVHVGMMVFIPLIAVAVYLLLRGVRGTAARISRIALVPSSSSWAPGRRCRASPQASSRPS